MAYAMPATKKFENMTNELATSINSGRGVQTSYKKQSLAPRRDDYNNMYRVRTGTGNVNPKEKYVNIYRDATGTSNIPPSTPLGTGDSYRDYMLEVGVGADVLASHSRYTRDPGYPSTSSALKSQLTTPAYVNQWMGLRRPKMTTYQDDARQQSSNTNDHYDSPTRLSWSNHTSVLDLHRAQA